MFDLSSFSISHRHRYFQASKINSKSLCSLKVNIKGGETLDKNDEFSNQKYFK
jgi:hypothetical protein